MGRWHLGFLGTPTYFPPAHSGSFWLVVLAVWKALFRPAHLTYQAVQSMHV